LGRDPEQVAGGVAVDAAGEGVDDHHEVEVGQFAEGPPVCDAVAAGDDEAAYQVVIGA
jgi:hypothetical protein